MFRKLQHSCFLTHVSRSATILAAFLALCSSIKADWVKGYFSPQAKIDSLNRFLILHDLRDSTLLGRFIAPAGDQNGDGIADFIACRSFFGNIFDDTTFLFLGGNPPSMIPWKRLDGFNSTTTNIGDINGDGISDFGQWYFWTDPNYFEIRLGGSLLTSSPWGIIPNFSNLPRGTKAADFDADGELELALIPDQYITNTVRIFEVSPIMDTTPKYIIHDTSTNFGDNLAIGDFNGDGYSDLVVASAYNRAVPFVNFYWGGPSFDALPDLTIRYASPQFGAILLPVGDFNGDGYDDILIAGGTEDRYGVYFGGPSIDSTIDVVIDRGGSFGFQPPTSASVGDLNGDGHPDIITGYQGLSYDDSYFQIFLGGPGADSLPDVKFKASDLLIRDTGFVDLVGFGSELSSVGDFNGDGIDDFAVYSKTDNCCHWWAEISLFAGWKATSTDVRTHNISSEDTIRLLQNFPNPFNATTTITYNLTRKGTVNLTVFNSLGRQVSVLAHGVQSAGVHWLTWDGMCEGKSLSSGVYYCRLTVDSKSVVRKMLMLK